MKAYVVTTGTVFALIVVAHAARVVVEGVGKLAEPSFLLTSALAVALTVWALRVWRRLQRGE